MRTILVSAAFAALLTLATSSQVHAYGTIVEAPPTATPTPADPRPSTVARAMVPTAVPAPPASQAVDLTGLTRLRVRALIRPPCTAAIPAPGLIVVTSTPWCISVIDGRPLVGRHPDSGEEAIP